MTAARKKARRGSATPASESTVYDGSRFCGTIMPKGGAFVARLTSGKSLGKFASDQLAMRAITAATRAERAPQRAQASAHSTASGASQS